MLISLSFAKKSYTIRTVIIWLGIISLILTPLTYYCFSRSVYQYSNIIYYPLKGFLPLTKPDISSLKESGPLLRGIEFNINNPEKLEFYIDPQNNFNYAKKDAKRLIQYFLGFLTIPESQLWVNLSSYESDRIIPESLGKLDIGKDLLLEDYLLKQLTSYSTDPKTPLGSRFWQQVRKISYDLTNNTNIKVNTFYKIWVIPNNILIYEHKNKAFIKEASLKLMLEDDYLAQCKDPVSLSSIDKNSLNQPIKGDSLYRLNQEVKNYFKKNILPMIEDRVNNSKDFIPLRQLYYSLILASYLKRKMANKKIYAGYIDKEKTKTLALENSKRMIKVIYDSYLRSLKEGMYDCLRVEYDPYMRKQVRRKYFSGGIVAKVDPVTEIKELDPNGFSKAWGQAMPNWLRSKGEMKIAKNNEIKVKNKSLFKKIAISILTFFLFWGNQNISAQENKPLTQLQQQEQRQGNKQEALENFNKALDKIKLRDYDKTVISQELTFLEENRKDDFIRCLNYLREFIDYLEALNVTGREARSFFSELINDRLELLKNKRDYLKIVTQVFAQYPNAPSSSKNIIMQVCFRAKDIKFFNQQEDDIKKNTVNFINLIQTMENLGLDSSYRYNYELSLQKYYGQDLFFNNLAFMPELINLTNALGFTQEQITQYFEDMCQMENFKQKIIIIRTKIEDLREENRGEDNIEKFAQIIIPAILKAKNNIIFEENIFRTAEEEKVFSSFREVANKRGLKDINISDELRVLYQMPDFPNRVKRLEEFLSVLGSLELPLGNIEFYLSKFYKNDNLKIQVFQLNRIIAKLNQLGLSCKDMSMMYKSIMVNYCFASKNISSKLRDFTKIKDEQIICNKLEQTLSSLGLSLRQESISASLSIGFNQDNFLQDVQDIIGFIEFDRDVKAFTNFFDDNLLNDFYKLDNRSQKLLLLKEIVKNLKETGIYLKHPDKQIKISNMFFPVIAAMISNNKDLSYWQEVSLGIKKSVSKIKKLISILQYKEMIGPNLRFFTEMDSTFLIKVFTHKDVGSIVDKLFQIRRKLITLRRDEFDREFHFRNLISTIQDFDKLDVLDFIDNIDKRINDLDMEKVKKTEERVRDDLLKGVFDGSVLRVMNGNDQFYASAFVVSETTDYYIVLTNEHVARGVIDARRFDTSYDNSMYFIAQHDRSQYTYQGKIVGRSDNFDMAICLVPKKQHQDLNVKLQPLPIKFDFNPNDLATIIRGFILDKKSVFSGYPLKWDKHVFLLGAESKPGYSGSPYVQYNEKDGKYYAVAFHSQRGPRGCYFSSDIASSVDVITKDQNQKKVVREFLDSFPKPQVKPQESSHSSINKPGGIDFRLNKYGPLSPIQSQEDNFVGLSFIQIELVAEKYK